MNNVELNRDIQNLSERVDVLIASNVMHMELIQLLQERVLVLELEKLKE